MSGVILRNRALFAELGSARGEACVIWAGNLNRYGYGRHSTGTGADRVTHLVHRVAYERAVGPLPEGMTIDHTCHNADPSCPGGNCPHRACVNVDHLEVVTRGENTSRRHQHGRAYPLGTHCSKGHHLDNANTYLSEGASRCLTCARDASRRTRAKRKALAEAGAR